jgi:hypothetical protein
MVGIMCRLDMKLIEEMHHAYSLDPNFINFDVFKLVLPGMVVLVDLSHCLVPCCENLRVKLSNYLVAHSIIYIFGICS